MSDLIAKYDTGTYTVYHLGSEFGAIQFLHGGWISARITANGKEYFAEPASETDKDIVMKLQGVVLFKFKFDYLWGSAELQVDGADTGFDVTGRWFKPGTRLVDADDNDVVVAVSDEQPIPDIHVTTSNSTADPILIMATVYYHIYTSISKKFVARLNY